MKLILLHLPSYLLSSIFVLLAFGQLGRLSFLNQQINVYAYEIIVGLYVCLAIFQYTLSVFKKIDTVGTSLLLFLGYMTVSWVLSLFWYNSLENTVSSLYLLRLWMYSIFFLVLHYERTIEKKPINWVPFGLFLAITIISSFIQYWSYPDLRNLEYLGWDPHLYRMFGLFFDPPIAAGVYGLCLLALLNQRNLKTGYRLALAKILLVMIFLTYSRGGLLALLVTGLIFALRKALIKELVIGCIVFVTVLLLLPKTFGEGVNLLRTSTIVSRISDYQDAVQIWQKAPIIGIGYNHIRAEKAMLNLGYNLESSHAGASFHSSFLIILVTGGIIGLGLFLYFMYAVVQINMFNFYSSLFLAVLSLTDNVVLHPFILCLWFMLLTYFILPSDKLR